MNTNRLHHFAAVVASLVLFVGCGDIFDGLNAFDRSFDLGCGGDAGDLSGVWEITGSGDRTGCDLRTLNAENVTISSAGLPFSHDPDLGEFELAENIRGFEVVDGNIDGTCVSFRTREKIGDQSITYTWSGRTSGDSTIEGSYTGDGPSKCDAAGTFEMRRTD